MECHIAYLIKKYVNIERIFSWFNAFELEGGVAMSPKRRSFLSLIFTCLFFAKSLLIDLDVV